MKEEERQRRIKAYDEAAKPLIAQLHRLGFNVESVADLFNRRMNYREAIPLLLEWLPRIDNLDVKESVVRTLSVKWARPVAARPLIEEFRRAPAEEELGLKWAIANGLEVVADESVFEEIVEFVRDRSHGRAREMLAMALGNMKDPRAVPVLLELLDDEQVVGHTLIGLRRQFRQKSVRADLPVEAVRGAVERFLDHPKTWVRREAKRVLEWIEKAEEEGRSE